MRKIKTVLLLAVMAAVLTMEQGGISVSAASGSGTADVSVTYMQSEARSMLSMINDFRTGSDAWYWNEDNTEQIVCSGLSELTYDYDLEKVAMQRAAEIALSFSHTRPDGTTCWTAYSEAGYSYNACGENIAYGSNYSSASSPFKAWQETNDYYDGQGHRRNMLSSSFNVCAVACVYYNGGYYWVQEFAKTSNSSTETSGNDSETSVSVNISADTISSLDFTVSSESLSLSEGESTSLPTLTAKILFTEGLKTVTVSPSCTWQVGDTSIVSVSGDVLTATGAGTTKLTTSFLGESVQVSVTVSKDISKCSIDLETTSYTYDGSAKQPSVTVKDGSTTLTSGTDYTVSYSNNTNAGTATVTVTGAGNYTGSLTETFTISAASISNMTLELSPESYTYDGSAKEPSVTVKDGSTTLGSGNYTVSYSSNTNVGTATVTVTGSGNYTGTLSGTFTISAADISKATVTLSSDSFEYDGTAKEPSVTVKDGSTTLTSGTDYTVSYSNNTEVGTATVTVTGKGNYSGTLTKTFTINKVSLSGAKVALSEDSYTYDGKAKEPAVTVTNGNTTLISGTDYTVSYSNNTEVGTATVTVTGAGNYEGTVSATFTIKAISLSDFTLTLLTESYTYDGKAKEPAVTVTNGNTTLISGTDYTVSYSDNTNAGTATVTVTGKGNYTGTLPGTFTINAAELSALELSAYSFEYNGSKIEPEVTVTSGSTTLANGTDYTVSYIDNTDVGTNATVTVTGTGNYTGTLSKTFTITVADIRNTTVTLSPKNSTYDGSAKKPSVTVTNGNTTLTSGTDYTVSYDNNINAGTATVTITGTGNYTETLPVNFTISPASISGSTVNLSANSYTYDGSAKKPTVTSVTMKNGTTPDYTVSYENNTNAGTASVKVKGTGNYTDTVTKNFTIKKASQTLTAKAASTTIVNGKTTTITSSGKGTISYSSSNKSVATVSSKGKITAKAPGTAKITVKAAGNGNYNSASKTLTIKVNPKATSLKSVKSSSSKKMTVKWKKVSGVTGYQIQYSTNKNFKSGNKTVKVSGASKVSKTISKLKKKKTYYVRVRTYKKVSGTNYYSAWSGKKKVKVK